MHSKTDRPKEHNWQQYQLNGNVVIGSNAIRSYSESTGGYPGHSMIDCLPNWHPGSP